MSAPPKTVRAEPVEASTTNGALATGPSTSSGRTTNYQTRLAVGLGCDRGAALLTLWEALEQALRLIDGSPTQIDRLASIDLKADEAALIDLAAALKRPLHFYRAPELATVAVPNPSATVMRHIGTPSVSEAAALLAAGAGKSANPHLLVEKHKWRGADGKHATISIARIPHD